MAANSPPPAKSVVRDTELECPTCGYNLTGLTESRCPECGNEFDRAALERMRRGAPVPATPWDDEGTLRNFLRTWRLVAFEPTRLARSFPRRHLVDHAVGYSLTCYGLAVAVFMLLGCLTCAVEHDASPLCPAIGASVAMVFGSWFCETATAGLLALIVKPAYAKERYHFWRGLTHYASGFVILTAAWSGLFGCLAVLVPDRVYPPVLCVSVLGLAIFIWWCGSLWRMVWCRGRSDSARVLGCAAVLVVGLTAMVIAFLGLASLMPV